MARLLDSSDARAALFAGGLSGALLGGALLSQYGFGYAPCTLCYWQRYAHWTVVGIAAAVLLVRGIGGLPRWLGPALLLSALLVSAGVAGFHVGVEFGWWEGPKACLAVPGALPTLNPDDPLAILDSGDIKPPACSEVVWRFLGLSMAFWNVLASLAGALGVWWLGFRDPRAAMRGQRA